MNILLRVIQIGVALMFLASGFMMIFMFDKISREVVSFGASSGSSNWCALQVLVVPASRFNRVGRDGLRHRESFSLGCTSRIANPQRLLWVLLSAWAMVFVGYGRFVRYRRVATARKWRRR
jgi:hypothetical protein